MLVALKEILEIAEKVDVNNAKKSLYLIKL